MLCCDLLPAQPTRQLNFSDAQGRQGPWEKRDPEGKLKYQGQFKNNKPYGTFRYFFPDGKIKTELLYEGETGIKARCKAYHPSGELLALGNFINEKRDSIWQFFDIAGNMIREETYLKNKLNGVSKTFYPGGKLCEEIQYRDSIPQGSLVQYFENGKKKLLGEQVDGLYHGSFIQWHPNGNKSAEGTYAAGIKSGTWKYYHEDGRTRFLETYKNGRVANQVYVNGEQELSYPNGIPEARYLWKNGKKNGPFTEYYNKGRYTLVSKGTDEEGAQEMHQQLVDTQIKCSGNYLDGKLDGKILFYSEDGKLTKTEFWKDGKKNE